MFNWQEVYSVIDERLLGYLCIGFCSQLIDSCCGMGYGVCVTAFLIYSGVPVKIASACVHLAEIFSSIISAISHYKLGNIDKRYLNELAFWGGIGAIIGTLTLLDGLDSIIMLRLSQPDLILA